MKTLFNGLKRRAREIIYVLTSLPILILLFIFTVGALSGGLILPLAVLFFLFWLSSMQYIAKWEIYRANFILRTQYPVVENWFRHPFFSWDGAKERITSTRSWLAVAYVFIGFFWSLVAFVLVVTGLSAFFVILSVLGVVVFSNFSRSFEVIDGGDRFAGSIKFSSETGQIRLEFKDSTQEGLTINSEAISWDLYSNWGLLIGVLASLLVLFFIPRVARNSAHLVEALLSGSFLPTFEKGIRRFAGRSKVSEREVREAMDKATLQPALSELSNREREILALMAQGKSNAGIAKTLYITKGSVEKHISNILSKLGLKTGDDNHRRVLAVLTYLGINQEDEQEGSK